MRFRLERVHYMPKDLDPGVLYFSEEYQTAAHLCPCGCGEKIRTPIGPTEWSIVETGQGPSLSPSVGNWQKPCKSHYWITRGETHWSESWTPEQIARGRNFEQHRRQAHFVTPVIAAEKRGFLARIGGWLASLFGKH